MKYLSPVYLVIRIAGTVCIQAGMSNAKNRSQSLNDRALIKQSFCEAKCHKKEQKYTQKRWRNAKTKFNTHYFFFFFWTSAFIFFSNNSIFEVQSLHEYIY